MGLPALSIPLEDAVARVRRLRTVAERSSARMLFALQRRRCRTPLAHEQVAHYLRDGFLLVSGLVPSAIADSAEQALWEGIGAGPDDPATWSRLGPQPHVLDDDRLTATYTDDVLEAAAQLAGGHVSGFARPENAFAVNRVPRTGEWRPNGAHLDYSLAQMRHRTFPRPFRICAMTYLSDVETRGGCTLAWPGSRFAVEALARSDVERYALMSALGADLDRLRLGEPVELTASRGDVLFLHPFCVHASSDNVRSTPRLALNAKW